MVPAPMPGSITANAGRTVLLWAGLLLATACATTQSIDQARDLSTSGLAYTEAVDSLLDTTVDQLIEFDTSVLIKSRRSGTAPDDLSGRLKLHNQGLSDLVAEIELFRAQNKLLKAYFLNLQALADSPVQDDIGGAVTALSGSLEEINQARGGEEMLTAAQQASIGQLAGLAAQSVQAAKLKRALARDAEVIAIQLVLHEDQLATIADILADRFEAENDLFFNEQVDLPFSDMEAFPDLPDDWRANREKHLRTSFTHQQLMTAQQAARQLRGTWTDIVQGSNDIGAIRVLISDVNEFVTVAGELQASSDDR